MVEPEKVKGALDPTLLTLRKLREPRGRNVRKNPTSRRESGQAGSTQNSGCLAMSREFPEREAFCVPLPFPPKSLSAHGLTV